MVFDRVHKKELSTQAKAQNHDDANSVLWKDHLVTLDLFYAMHLHYLEQGRSRAGEDIQDVYNRFPT